MRLCTAACRKVEGAKKTLRARFTHSPPHSPPTHHLTHSPPTRAGHFRRMFPGIDNGTYKTPPTTRTPQGSVAEAWKKSLDGKVPYDPSTLPTKCKAPDKVWEKSPHANPLECSGDHASSTAVERNMGWGRPTVTRCPKSEPICLTRGWWRGGGIPGCHLQNMARHRPIVSGQRTCTCTNATSRVGGITTVKSYCDLDNSEQRMASCRSGCKKQVGGHNNHGICVLLSTKS